ncbi:MAG: LPS export ABC transporter periplasmic protein LptC [Bacteroidaceae bacterium]|nr:LPS export ABC transporter periplasmic protein LptC [Bacteroidaceae bacterium]
MQLSKVRNYKTIGITTVFWAVVMLLFFSACGRNKKALGEAITNRDSLPALETHDVTTLISDSGIIRYRITTPLWLVFDKLSPSRWSFEEGIYLENFDEDNNVMADIKADTAYYYDKKKLWELRGDVQIENLQGERFNTELLFWDQDAQKVYSDKFIRIEQKDRIITGHGFDSNQQFTIYTIHKPEGIFYVDEDKMAATPADSLANEEPATPAVSQKPEKPAILKGSSATKSGER